MAERIDWTKFLVPRTIPNKQLGVDSSVLDTTDFVTIPSAAEFQDQKNLFNIKKMTQFASYLSGSTYSSERYWLRDSGASTDGVYIQSAGRAGLHNGVAPSISLKLPEGYTLEQLIQQFGLTKKIDGYQEFYQVDLGEYPKTQISLQLETELSNRLYGKVSDDSFRCTGHLYTTNGSSWSGHFEARQNPEFEYRGEKYVYVSCPGGNGKTWFKVEPLNWWVRNFDEVANGKAKQLDLDCINIVLSGIPFHPGHHDDDLTAMWQNSLVRAFLNSADSRQLDGNPDYKIDGCDWNFKQSGFLQQALNMTREPIREYTIPDTEKTVGRYAFDGCQSLEKIIIPASVEVINDNLFQRCHAQVMLDITNTSRSYTTSAFSGEVFKYIYVPKTTDAKWMVFSPYTDNRLKKDYWHVDYNYQNVTHFMNDNYRTNYIQLHNWKEKQQIKFIPPEFTLELFPASEMKNYFIHNNHKRWAELVGHLHFDLLKDWQKINYLTDLMKIYYALGGFSKHQGERDKAFDYVLQHVANVSKYMNAALDEQQQAEMMGDEIHLRFSGLVLKGPYNPIFAQFFMKYYHANPDFMEFNFYSEGHYNPENYLCAAHNSFEMILMNYPHRVVRGNTKRDLLTPELVAKYCALIKYQNVNQDNQKLAEIVGRYGYGQSQFNEIQAIYNQAKTLKDKYVIRADRAVEVNGVSFRILAKDDPLGFVIGNITNCCQHIGGAADSCVRDGYINPDAGFLVFEETLRDENGKPTGQKRILGQAYVWYDPQTQTVCYDNIEIPKKILDELKSGEKQKKKLSVNTLMKTVVNSADEIMTTMNKNGTKVKRVTIGKAYNDLKDELSKKFKLTKNLAQHRGYHGYTDAREQYLVRTYDETTKRLAGSIMDTAEQIMQADKKLDNEKGL